jgi:hypothetical protein
MARELLYTRQNMSIPRCYSIGAIAPDVGSFKGLVDRLEVLDLAPDSVVVLARRRDERLARAISPEVRVRSVESTSHFKNHPTHRLLSMRQRRAEGRAEQGILQ